MATIKEVAKQAGVSVGTVSNVLSGAVAVSQELRERVLAAVRALDYHPDHVARSLKTKATKLIGMVISDISNPFFPLVVRGAEDVVWKSGYLLITFNTDDRIDRERQILSTLRGRKVDGLLLVVATGDGDTSHIARAQGAGIPIVCIDRTPTDIEVDTVGVDNVGGARECVEQLIQSGYRSVAILTGSLHLQTAKDRLQGYCEAMDAARIPIDPALIVEGDFRQESGFDLTSQLLARDERPTALFSSNGVMAMGALQAIEQSGLRCPEDIALSTFDDLPFFSVLRPQLTAVAQPAYQLGQQAAELLMRKIECPEERLETTHLTLKAELRVRQSSTPLAHHRAAF